MIIACVITTLFAILFGGSVWMCVIDFNALDNTFYSNTRGYLTNTGKCHLEGNALQGFWLSGYLDISFYGIQDFDNNTLINQTIPPLGVCLDTYNECCHKWVGKELYVQVSYWNDTYYVVDLSDDTVQGRKEITAGFIMTLIFALSLLACYVAFAVKFFCRKNKEYEIVN